MRQGDFTSTLYKVRDMAKVGRHVPGTNQDVFKIISAVSLGAIACVMLMQALMGNDKAR